MKKWDAQGSEKYWGLTNSPTCVIIYIPAHRGVN